MQRALLFGLWLLVMLTAIAIGLRMLDLSALTAPPVESPVRQLASADAVNAMRGAALAAAMSRGADPLDDPAEELIPESLPEPLPVGSPSLPLLPTDAPLMTADRLSPAATLAVERPAATATAPKASGRQASGSSVCADALQAMQLCPDTR